MSYSPSIRGCQQWGDDIDDDSRVMKWLRANLEPTDRDVTTKTTSFAKLLWEATKIERDPLDEPTPGYLIRSPDEIVGDYLYHIAEKLYEEIVVQAGRHIPEQIPTDFVFTYPPQWSRLLKQRYFQIVQSVFNTDLFPRRRDFYFVTESEANALAGVMSAEMNLGYLSQLRSTIFLSGTFSANAYVNQRIRQLGFSRRIVVYNSLEDAMVSKTRGAIIHTLSLITGEPRPILRTSFHYGVASCAAYDTTKHATEDAKVNPADGAKLAVNQITWLFDKGEVLFMDDKEARKKTVILLRKFRQQDIVTGTISRVTFLACPAGKKPCTLRDPPSDGTQLVYLDYGLSDIPESQREKVEIKRRFLNKTFFKSVLTLEASMDISNIVITLRCGGTLLAERTMATA
ncbi:hypothetical protein OQA88_6950 [Cercophora sp. LCS_1]